MGVFRTELVSPPRFRRVLGVRRPAWGCSGPAVGPAEAVVADAEEPLGEAQRGHQQGDAQEEQHPLAHAGLLLLQVQAQEVDAAGAHEGALQASWAGRNESGRWAGPGTPLAPQP